MDKIIIIDNSGISEKLEKFLSANKNNIILNADLDDLYLKNNSLFSEIIKSYENKHKIKIHSKDKIWFFKSIDIVRIAAKKDNTILYLSNGSKTEINETIDQIEKQLKDFSFIRIHRDHFINVNYISKIAAESDIVELAGGEVVPVEDQRKHQILSILKKHNKL